MYLKDRCAVSNVVRASFTRQPVEIWVFPSKMPHQIGNREKGGGVSSPWIIQGFLCREVLMKTNENVMEVLVPTKIDTSTLESPGSVALRSRLAGVLFSPVWFCLLLALCVRVWLVIHTRGFMDGDEALLGVQAQHILQGERPIYYYGQPYMGSLEAYLVAIVFGLAGSALWTLRIVPIVLSLVVVWLTWCLAGALADGAKLSSTTRRWFMMVAALLATLPPLYDVVMELRTWGGAYRDLHSDALVALCHVASDTALGYGGFDTGNSYALGCHWLSCRCWNLDLSPDFFCHISHACLDWRILSLQDCSSLTQRC